jgi:tetratricopeptide (TPR) repeat protein
VDESILFLEELVPESARRYLLQRDLARAHELRGKVLVRRGRHEESLEALSTAVSVQADLTTSFPEDTRLASWLVELEVSYAHGLSEAGRIDDAREQLERIRVRLAGPQSARLADLSELRVSVEEGLSVIGAQSGRHMDAEAAFDRALAELEAAREAHGKEPWHRASFAGILEHRAELAHQMRNWKEARIRVDRALEVLSVFADEEKDVPMWPSRLASLLSTSANVRSHLGEPEDALEDHSRAIELLEALVRRFPDEVMHRQRLAIAYAERGGAQEHAGRGEAAAADLAHAAEVLESVHVERPTSGAVRTNLASMYGNLSDVVLALGDLDRAQEASRRALELLRGVRSGRPLGTLTELLTQAGRLAAIRGETDSAKELFMEAVTVARGWFEASPEDPVAAYSMAFACLSTGSHLINADSLEEAEAVLLELLAPARMSMAAGIGLAPRTLALGHLELAHIADLRGDASEVCARVRAASEEAGLDQQNCEAWCESFGRALALFRRCQ